MQLSNCDSDKASGKALIPNSLDNGQRFQWWPWKVTATARRHRRCGFVVQTYIPQLKFWSDLRHVNVSASPFGGAEAFWLAGLLCLLMCCSASAQQSEPASEQSGWELSIANGLLLFKREKSVQLHTEQAQPLVDSSQSETEPYGDAQIVEESWFVPAVNSHFSSDVSGIVARSKVIQTFKNPTDEWLHGTYQFPLPEDAAVDTLKMRIGQREIVGEIQRKQEARKRFAQAKRTGQKASLVEQQKPNMFTTNLANIAPGDEIEIEIQFQQQARYVDGEFRLRFPTTYIPRAMLPVTELEEEQAYFDPELAAMFESQFTADINLNAGQELAYIKIPHYELHTQQYPEYRYELRMDNPEPGVRDLEINWRYQELSPQVLHYRQASPDGEYGLVMLLPGDTQQTPNVARQVTFVIDTSSSMGGNSIKQAKAALQLAVQGLQENDHFNIIEFNSDAFELWYSPRPAHRENKRIALEYLARLDARGGTDVFSALQLALARQPQKPSDAYTLKQLVFITDGAIGYETQLLTEIENKLDDVRLFTVGIGAAPNSYFMVEAASVGRGSYTHISDLNQVNERMSQLLQQLSSPSITDIEVDFGMDVEVFPNNIPDLYHGEPLLLSYLAPAPVSTLLVEGMRGGYPRRQRSELAYLDQHPGVAKHWAKDKIRHLSRQKRLVPAAGSHDQQSIAERITQVALKHQLVSPYTSLIAVEKRVSNPSMADKSAQVSRAERNLLMASMPNTAAGSRQAFALALLALCVAIAISFLSWRHNRVGGHYVSQ